MMNTLFRRFSYAALAVFVTAALVACGGGSGGGSATVSASSGSVSVLMTDAPSDDFDNIYVRVEKIELLSESGRVTLFDGDETFDLLDLADEARLFAIRNGVPVGYYGKVRLTLLDLELVKRDDQGNIIESHHPHLPGNGKLDLNPRGDFYVAPDQTLLVEIDIDANKSLFYHQTGNGTWRFRPVVFVNVLRNVVDGKFIRLHGVVQDIDDNDNEFELCRTDVPVRQDDGHHDTDAPACVEVQVVDSTSIFDEQGQPAGFGDLVEGEEATVYGRFRREDLDGDEDDDDYDDYDDRDDRYDDRELHDLEFLAALIELGPEGTFASLDGVAQTDVDLDDRFTFTIDPDQGFGVGTGIEVQLQDGTLIVDRYGVPLPVSAIGDGVIMTIDGVLDISEEPDVLYAALIVIDTEALTQVELNGTVLAYPDGSCGLGIATDSGDRSIDVTGAAIYLVSSDGLTGSSEPIDAADLEPGQEVDVYGTEG
ncbi:MAG: DUF4382 domain-containing protein, partial [Thiogranum sp.]|nr:DUF4382 domain-containing protein [Thiogranum sp.]